VSGVAARLLVNGDADAHIAADDRGLCYGDGLFETVLFMHGRAPLWARHMQRLAASCARLSLPAPDPALLAREAEDVSAGLERAIVRITYTRGSGPRGYAFPRAAQAARIVAAVAAPGIPAGWYHSGIRVRACALRLSEQPRLAGIKHLNRLEQVLARAEWDDDAIVEGILCDAHGRVISATAANIFAVIDGRLVTPALERCGVAGVARAEVLAQHADCEVRDLMMVELLRADEVFLSNSVRGIVPVTALDDRRWEVGETVRALLAHWRALGLATGALG
jgi:4-amino-4-deoxychorismate lyase